MLATILIAALGAVLAFGLAGCGGSSSGSASSAGSSGSASASSGASSSASASASASSAAATGDLTTIKVAAVPTPHAEILRDAVAPLMAEQGYTLEVQEFTGYELENPATVDGDVDANYFQHKPYLDEFNAENDGDLVPVVSVHYEPFGIYAGKDKSLTELGQLADGATVAVPNDATNEARALLLLEQAGLISLDPSAGIAATKLDVVDNPKNLVIQEVNAELTPSILGDVDVAAINSNYAIEAGLVPSKDAIVTEDPNGEAAQTYANLLVVKEANAEIPAIQALAKALNSDEVRTYIQENYEGAVVPIF